MLVARRLKEPGSRTEGLLLPLLQEQSVPLRKGYRHKDTGASEKRSLLSPNECGSVLTVMSCRVVLIGQICHLV